MILSRILIRQGFTKISKGEVLQSNQQQLVDKIIQEYGFKQFQTKSTVSLLEAHHLYKVFNPGDWVLDIGAGPYWSWTDLALKLTKNNDKSNLVISNDKIETLRKLQNNITIQGDFLEESIRSKIAMKLQKRSIDTILIDATSQYSGNLNMDAGYTMRVFMETMSFSEHYLRKGGNIVFRTLQCLETIQNEDKASFFFNEVYKHKPSNIPVNYYSFFYVLKGFRMSSKFDEIANFHQQYRRASTSQKKRIVVEKYQQTCNWDPVKILNNDAKQKIMDLKDKGHKNSQVIKIFQKDHFIKAKQIVRLIDTLNDEKASPAAQLKAKQMLIYDRNITDPKLLPQTQDEFDQIFLEQVQKISKQHDSKKSKNKQKPKQMKGPLRDDEIYMKQTKSQDLDPIQKQYLEDDLLGYKSDKPIGQNIQQEEQEIKKLMNIFSAYEKQNGVIPDQKQNQKIFQTLKNYRARGQKTIFPDQRNTHEFSNEQKQVRKILSDLDDPHKSSSNQEKFDFGEELQANQKQARMRSDYEEAQNSKSEYMKTKEKKTDRYINQRRSKRKNNNSPKYKQF